MQPPRNARCPCGSGKKYKHCHLLEEWRAQGRLAPARPRVGAIFGGTLLGKHVYVTTDPGTTRVADLRRHLSRFNLAYLLRQIGQVSAEVEGKSLGELEGVAISRDAPAYVARVAIEASSDEVPAVPTPRDLAEAFRIFNCLEEPGFRPNRTESWALEHLVRMGNTQFSGRDDLRTALARTWTLFHDLWPLVAKAKDFDVASAITNEVGVSLRQLMMFGFAYAGKSPRGHFVPYDTNALASLPQTLGITSADNERFLSWISATYEELRQIASSNPDAPGYDKYTLSPFLVKPVVRPSKPPPEAPKSVLLVPVPRFVALRVTDGLYHALATAHAGNGKANPFRKAFGHVFEAYVGRLLDAGSGAAQVAAAREYGPKVERRESPDWLVLDGTRLLVVEAKESGLTLNTRMLGDLDVLRTDLEKRLAKGVRQLLTFRNDLRRNAPGLEDLADVTEVELLLVVYGELPWANWLLRDTIAEGLPEAKDVHICTIGELENLQRCCWGRSPFDLLASKRKGNGDAVQHDLHDWMYSMGVPPDPHPVLRRVADELFASWGAGPE